MLGKKAFLVGGELVHLILIVVVVVVVLLAIMGVVGSIRGGGERMLKCKLYTLTRTASMNLIDWDICGYGTKVLPADDAKAMFEVFSMLHQCYAWTNNGRLKENCRLCYEFSSSSGLQGYLDKLEGFREAMGVLVNPVTRNAFASELPAIEVKDYDGTSLVDVDYIHTGSRYRVLYSYCQWRKPVVKLIVVPTDYLDETVYPGLDAGCYC